MSKTHRQHGKTGFVEDQRDFFDKLITQDWEEYQSPIWNKQRQFEVRQILRLIPPPRRVLNVGCGCGYQDREFARTAAVEAVIGIDNSVNSVKQANLHYPHPKVERVVADIFDPDTLVKRFGRFDLVVSFQVLEHLSRPEEFLAACATLARDRGHVVIVTPNQKRLGNRILALFGRQPQLSDPLHFTEYSLAELRQLGNRLGERSIKLHYLARFGYDFHLALKGITLIGPETPFTMELGALFPGLANIIGVIFQKSAP